MSTTKKKSIRTGTSTARKTNTSAKRKTKTKAEVKPENSIMDEIALVALLVVSVFLFVSNFGIGGAVGGAVSRVLFGLFGLFHLPIKTAWQ